MATEEPNVNDVQEEPKHDKNDYTLKQWDAKIEEEEAAWRQLGINLNMMQYSGHDMFFVQAKLQAITNCIIDGNMTEENLNLWLKLVVYESMREIRTAIEPQVRQAKLAALQGGVQVPEIIMPWDSRHKNRRGPGNGS